jgi:hypothetical protein
LEKILQSKDEKYVSGHWGSKGLGLFVEINIFHSQAAKTEQFKS